MAGSLAQSPKENVPDQRLSFFLVSGDRDPQIEVIRAAPVKLKENKFPTIYHEVPNQGNGYITELSIFEQLVMWIVGLDRL